MPLENIEYIDSASINILSVTSLFTGTGSLFGNTSSYSTYLTGSHTGSTFGTSSWSISSSWSPSSISSSWASSSISASYSPSSGGGTTLTTGSIYPITSSWANNVITSSYSLTASTIPYNVLWTGSDLVLTGSQGNTPLFIKSAINNYFEINIQNLTASNSASTDFTATNDKGTSTTYYVNLGINSSTYSAGFVGGFNDSYLYSTGSNLFIGNITPSKNLYLFAGGFSNTSSVILTSTSLTSVPVTSSALILSGSTGLTPLSIISTVNNYAEVNNQNTNIGSAASTDFVATNNSGSATSYYVNLGINNSNYNGIIGVGNDSYLFNTGSTNSNFYIGNTNPSGNLSFFVGGTTKTGSAGIIINSTSITASFPIAGTSSWSTNSRTSSNGAASWGLITYNGTSLVNTTYNAIVTRGAIGSYNVLFQIAQPSGNYAAIANGWSGSATVLPPTASVISCVKQTTTGFTMSVSKGFTVGAADFNTASFSVFSY
jgi:hypothetical protein